MNILSLFWGIECWRVALDQVWIPVEKYFSSEVDPYPIKISSANYPEIIHIGDVKNVKFNNHLWYWENQMIGRCEITKIDLLIGGSPCQDLSIAKKNWKGLEWEKSGLFYEYVRILWEVKPKYFLLENVASMKKSEKEKIDKILAEIYPDTICYTFDSILTSAWRRKRHYWTNIPWITPPEDRGIYLKDILEDIPLSDPIWKPVKPEYLDTLRSMDWWMTEINRIWRQRQWYEFFYPESKVSSFTVAHASNRKIIIGVPKKSLALTASYAKKNQQNFFLKSEWQMILARDDMNYYTRKLTVREWARVMNLPDTFVFPVSDHQAYHGLWNGWDAGMIAHLFSFIPNFK